MHAAGRGSPTINLTDGREILTNHVGPDELRRALEQNQAQPRSLDSADFDEDGVPDLISGYEYNGSGIVTVLRGNVDSIYPNSPEAAQRRKDGTFTAAPFLSPARVFGVSSPADFIGAGDFDGDSHWDVVVASRSSKHLILLSGYGNGGFRPAKEIKLEGLVTAMTTGEINRRDGLNDVVVSVIGPDGPKAMVFEGPHGALRAEPEVFPMPAPVTALALGQLDDRYEMDLAIAAGHELVIIHGRDRQLLLEPEVRTGVVAASREQRAFSVAINSLALGDFKAKQQTEIAVLFADGALQLLSRGTAGKAKQGVAQSIGLWQSEALMSDDRKATRLLGSAKVSSIPGDDLLAVEGLSGRLQIIRPGQTQPRSIANGHTATELQHEPVLLEPESGAPVAVMPMRLNSDALSDLMVLHSGKSTPTTISTTSAMTFVVTNTNDTGPGSLRAAVTAAEANPGADTIIFQIGSGPQTITPQSFFPSIFDPVTIDATTQPGFAGQPLIQMNGINNTVDFAAFDIYAGSSTVRGFVINRFHSNGLSLVVNPGNIVEGNYIGTDVTGTIALPNDFRGIGIGGDAGNTEPSSNNRIGGTTPQARNIISGNKVHGVRILNLGSTGNIVQGNYIGTDVTGTLGLGNEFEGIYIGGGVNNTVGGTQPGAGNVLSSNGSAGTTRTASGVHIGTFPFLTGASGNLVQGNRVGTNAAGTAALGNAHEGVQFEDGATSNTIGGTTAAARNIISGNHTNGVDLGFAKAVTLNQVLGNYIGTDVTGNNPLGNDLYGIFINVNSVNNTIRDNRIAFNGAGGIFIPNVTPDPGDPGVRIAIDSNAIFANGGLGIDLGSTGITPNDPLDTDGGANLQQNFPSLTSLTPASSAAVVDQLTSDADSAIPTASEASLNVSGTLNSTPNSTFTIHWYFSGDPQCTNNQAGSQPLAFGRVPDVMTNAAGNAVFNFPFDFPAGTSTGVINCTATDSAGNTSEFSACFPVTAPATRTLTVASVNPGSGVNITVSPNDNSGQGSDTTQFQRTYYNGASVTLTAPATASGNNFQKWQRDGVDLATTQSTNVTMDANHTMTAIYVAPQIQVTVQTSPAGRSFTVDGTTYTTTQNLSWTAGSSHTISTTSPQTGGTGTRHVWSGWNDGGAISHTVAPSSNTTYTANFTTQHFLTMNAGTGGTVSPMSGFFNSGLSVPISATADPGFIFSGWTGIGSGSFTGSSNPASVTINGPITETASFTATPPSTTIQFSAGIVTAVETLNATTKLDLTVSRSGNTSGAASVNYASSNGTANERSDYLAALGTLNFQAGETTKIIPVFIVDDAYGEVAENFTVTLSNPVGASLGSPSTITVTINSNESVNGPNPVRDASFSSDFFVRQHYVDFFNRAADPAGLAFWKNQIDECTTQACREIRRINVSAAFYISIEFQETGYLVYKTYQGAFNSGEQLDLRNFLPDTQQIGRGFIQGQPGADALLETNKQTFFLDFVQRPNFLAAGAYPVTLTAAQFVDKLNANTYDPLNPSSGPALTQSQRDALVAQLSPNPASSTLRAQVLRSVSENGVFHTRQFNKGFVLMQYFGYLRRNPNSTPDTNFDGYNFWLNKLNQFNGNFVNAEMVKAFIISGEYPLRFGP